MLSNVSKTTDPDESVSNETHNTGTLKNAQNEEHAGSPCRGNDTSQTAQAISKMDNSPKVCAFQDMDYDIPYYLAELDKTELDSLLYGGNDTSHNSYNTNEDYALSTNEKHETSRWRSQPFLSFKASDGIARIYDVVVSGNAPNCNGARIKLKTSLNIAAWERESTGHPDDTLVLDGVNYGFPLQYGGGPLYNDKGPPQNHHSARQYPEAIHQYISKEKRLGTLIGPFDNPPFTPWCHVSPLMSRPKSDSHERRIIVDLSFPDGGVNKHIPSNEIDGEPVAHNLPTIQQALLLLQEIDITEAYMATIDISRAYRNFRSCPADWPLLCIKHENEYFIDCAMPFGSRMSSFYMQNTAQFIARSLEKRGVKVLIYLDDMIIVSRNYAEAQAAYETTLSLLMDLGLPVATHKLSPPSRSLVWLGICLDLDANTLSIPTSKLDAMRTLITGIKGKTSLTTKQMQSLIGTINHIGRAVPPARLFMCRLLDALRKAQGKDIPVTPSILADIRWFDTYLTNFNGKAIIPDTQASLTIEVDACLTGMGGHDGHAYYTMPVSEKMAEKHSISRLECMNCLLAVRTLLGPSHMGRTVVIKCDNQSSVFTYQNGRAKDIVMTACARAMWLHGARLNINFIFQHVPGVEMVVADTLSGVYNDTVSGLKAQNIVHDMSLVKVIPKRSDLDYSSFL